MPRVLIAALLLFTAACGPRTPSPEQQQYLELVWQRHDDAVLHAKAAAEVAFLMTLADELDTGPDAPTGMEVYAADYAETVGTVKDVAAQLKQAQDPSELYQAAALFGAAMTRFDNMRRDGVAWPSFRESE